MEFCDTSCMSLEANCCLWVGSQIFTMEVRVLKEPRLECDWCQESLVHGASLQNILAPVSASLHSFYSFFSPAFCVTDVVFTFSLTVECLHQHLLSCVLIFVTTRDTEFLLNDSFPSEVEPPHMCSWPTLGRREGMADTSGVHARRGGAEQSLCEAALNTVSACTRPSWSHGHEFCQEQQWSDQ
jgi:hypothetical protein